MKRSILAIAMIVTIGSALSAAGQAAAGSRSASKPATMATSSVAKPVLRCTGADGKSACTAEQARDVATGLATGKRMHKPFLVDVESITPGANGTLDCKQTNGSACTDEQISAIVDFTMSTHSHGTKASYDLAKGTK